MSVNVVNKNSYLRTTREFPEEAELLSVEIDRAYIDVASAVNDRTIGIFTSNVPSVTGESWYVTQNRRQQTLRQAYAVTGTGNIAHGINTSQIIGFTRIYGTFTDGTVWYTLPYVDEAAANNQIKITVTSTNIVITAGAGTPPTVSSGYVVLEWLA